MEETCEIGTDKFKTSSTSKDSKRGGNKESNDEEQEMLDQQVKNWLVLWKPSGQEVTREDEAETETTKKTRQTATFESTYQLLLKIRNTLQKQKQQLAMHPPPARGGGLGGGSPPEKN